MQFSLVVTCFNEMQSLPRWYADVMGQTRPPDEIVIVDSESTDGTTEFLKDWAQRDPRVRVIVQKCKPARGHNIGNEAAKYEHILSTDMGVRLCPVWCEELMAPFEADPAVEVVAGSVLLDSKTIETAVARADYYFDRNAHVRSADRCVVGNNSCGYTKTVWRELGGLPEDLTFYADDSVFGRQILAGGYKVAIAPKALVFWARPGTLRELWKEAYNYGRGDGEAAIKTPYVFKLYQRRLLPKRLVPFLNGLRVLQRRLCSPRPLMDMVKRGDIKALMIVPILFFGKGYAFASGYLAGDEYGTVHCQDCRMRLADAHERRVTSNSTGAVNVRT